MHKFMLSLIIIAFALAIIIIGLYFLIKKKSKPSDNLSANTEIEKIKSADESTMMIQPSLEMLNLIEKIEIDNRSCHKLILSSLNQIIITLFIALCNASIRTVLSNKTRLLN